MFSKTEQDTGLIETPTITPHIEIIIFEDEELMFGKMSKTLAQEKLKKINLCFYVDAQGNGDGLAGPLHRDIMRVVDGKRSRAEIVSLMRDCGHAEMDINIALVNLAYRFLLVSADYQLPDTHAALFSTLGISPRQAEQTLSHLKICVLNIGTHQLATTTFASALNGMSCGKATIVDDETDADIVVVMVDDYLQPELQDLNKKFLATGKRWMPLKLSGVEGMTGPIFNLHADGQKNGEQKNGGFCLQCMRTNLKNNRELRSFLGHNRAGAGVAKEHIFDVSVAQGRASDAIVQLIRAHLSADKLIEVNRDGHYHSIGQYVLSSNLLDHQHNWHYVNQRPQCACCGLPQMRDTQRLPQAVDLSSGVDGSIFTSGGMKSRSPLQTWNQYQHLISPLSGVVTAVIRSSPADDSWLHVYWAGSNLAIVNKLFHSLTNSLRTKSAGKGRSDMQAKVSALCEALERTSGVYDGTEIHRRAKFSDFDAGCALRPNDVMQFSDAQFNMRHEVAAAGHRFYRLPELDFDEQTEVEWTPFWSVTREQFVWVMSIQAYFSYFSEEMALNKFMANPDSNGAASGNTPAEAFTQGFMELVERDAYAIWWYNRLKFPAVDIESFNDPFLQQLINRYRTEYNRTVWVLDITNDFGIPVFVAVSERVDKDKRDICVSAGAHFDPHIALLRAVCELNQYASAVLTATDDPGSYSYMDGECLNWWQTATLETHPYLVADADSPKTTPATYPLIERSQDEEVQACIDAVHAKNMEVLVLDQTRPDIGLPVIKVLVPGMRHFWARFRQGRLFDVPVAMGWQEKPTREEDLNPIPVFI